MDKRNWNSELCTKENLVILQHMLKIADSDASIISHSIPGCIDLGKIGSPLEEIYAVNVRNLMLNMTQTAFLLYREYCGYFFLPSKLGFFIREVFEISHRTKIDDDITQNTFQLGDHYVRFYHTEKEQCYPVLLVHPDLLGHVFNFYFGTNIEISNKLSLVKSYWTFEEESDVFT